MDTIAQLGRLAAMTKYAEGEGLMASLKDFAANNPTAFGAAGGGLLGAGAGYLLGDKEDRLRAALAGAGIGAGIGGVGGYAAGNRMAGEKGLEALHASTGESSMIGSDRDYTLANLALDHREDLDKRIRHLHEDLAYNFDKRQRLIQSRLARYPHPRSVMHHMSHRPGHGRLEEQHKTSTPSWLGGNDQVWREHQRHLPTYEEYLKKLPSKD